MFFGISNFSLESSRENSRINELTDQMMRSYVHVRPFLMGVKNKKRKTVIMINLETL
jgi:hypothetical protein